MINKRIISIFELILIVLSTVAFSYFMSTNLPGVFERESSAIQFLARPIMPMVSANGVIPSGCCKETLSGASCLEMILEDNDLCKADLIGTRCEFVSECQKGCCYDSDSGMCSLNAPKEKCTSNGGEWDPSSTCNIQQCQVGCCILGDGAAMTTTRECTQMADNYKIEKVFKPLDNKGSCDAYADLTDEGACIFASDDYSKDKNCIFTTKSKCVGKDREFKKDYLCTSKELNTTCEKTEETSCIDGDDRVYFIDSCGNKANIYDSTKTKQDSYWEKIIPASQSCSGSPETCGNCDYTTGSICTKYFTGRDLIKPAIGEYVCKNLNCINGRKHGESWCVSDAEDISKVGYAVGTRSYVASCFEGEIKLEGCADFNQEICIENKDESLNYSEASCIMNDWRSCVYANDFDSYAAIERKCETLPQCIMFNDIPGNEKYKGLPGFKEGITNDEQGKAGSVGSGMNVYVMQCMPRFTPGYQFWNTVKANPLTSSTKQITSSNIYGGSKTETDGICNLGTFKCVSHIETTTPLINPSPSDKENPECNMQAVSQSNQKVSLMMEGLNERCRMLGSCGVQYNTQGKIGEKDGFVVERMYVDKDGQTHKNYTTEGYSLPKGYLNKTLEESQKTTKMGEIKILSDLTLGEAVYLFDSMELASTSIISSPAARTSLSTVASEAQSQMNGGDEVYIADKSNMGAIGGITLGIGAIWGAASTFLWPVAFAAVGAIIGSYIGGMIANSAGMSPGETTALVGVFSGFGMAGMSGIILAICAMPPPLIGCVVVAIVMIIIGIVYMIYSLFTGVDHEYYITAFECRAWAPPKTGNCNECNNDVRPCSEFKCRSIGNNCRYFIDNGEPGYCATLADVWSAKITPWNEKLTSGNKYTNISSSGFKIVSNEQNSKEVTAWKPVRFGITTDEQAICKLDTNHSKKYDEMRYTFSYDKDYTTGKVDGLHHWIILSPHVTLGETELDEGVSAPPMKEGDNEYFIICQNFAGMTNSAPFVVQVRQKEGPDLTPPQVTRVSPMDNPFIAYGSSNLTMWVYLDEPAECRYSIDYDYNFFEEMPSNMSCLTGKEQGFYGEWPCMAALSNITQETKLFIKCKDQPGLNETDIYKRNQNAISLQYSISVCKTGLNIDSISPMGIVEMNSSQEINLEVKTSGCINNGESECAFKLPYYGDTYSSFFNTGGLKHAQPLSGLGTGERTVNVECIDKAGNIANATTNFTVFVDDNAPGIIRVYTDLNNLIFETNENAICGINTNTTKGCDFEFDTKTESLRIKHSITLTDKMKQQTLYVRCLDSKGNEPNGCTNTIKLINEKEIK